MYLELYIFILHIVPYSYCRLWNPIRVIPTPGNLLDHHDTVPRRAELGPIEAELILGLFLREPVAALGRKAALWDGAL